MGGLRRAEWVALALLVSVVGVPPLGLALYAASGPAFKDMPGKANLHVLESEQKARGVAPPSGRRTREAGDGSVSPVQ